MGQAIEFIQEVMTRGGWVMYPLLVLSVVTVALCFERAVFWIRTNRGVGRLDRIAKLIRTGDRAGARKLVGTNQTVYGRFLRDLLDGPATEADAHALAEAVRPDIERFTATLSTIITAAPMLGILGTVIGIIRSFGLLGTEVVTDPSLVADGIAQALFTTAFGLVISLVALFPYAIYRAQANRALSLLEVLAAAAVERGGE